MSKLNLNSLKGLGITLNQVTVNAGTDLQIDGTTLRPVTSNDELILQANGTGSVVAEEVFALGNASSTPTGTSGRIKLYKDSEGPGGTGLFFVNNTVNGEVTSKRKTMLMSMIF